MHTVFAIDRKPEVLSWEIIGQLYNVLKCKKAMYGTFKIRFCSIIKYYSHVLQQILKLNRIFNNIKYLFYKIAGSL